MESNNIIKLNHKTNRGNFNIEITEIGIFERDAYQDIKVKFSITVTNTDNPSWRINFGDTDGRIKKIEDKDKLVGKLVDEIKLRINEDKQGNFYIGEPTLDLTK